MQRERGLLFVLSAPAGTGKTTLVHMLEKEFPHVKKSISFTTRKPRKNEKEGVDYYFISKEAFEEKLKRGDFLEHAKVFDHYYGTSKEHVEKKLKEKIDLFLVIDTQGAAKLREKVEAVFIFLLPPSLEILEKRLAGRKTESEREKELRLSWAKKEMEEASKYDYKIINDDLEKAYNALRSIVIAEERRKRKT